MNVKTVACLAGDGVGPELMAAATRALERVSKLHQLELDDRFPGGHGLELDLTRGEGQVEPERSRLGERLAPHRLGLGRRGGRWSTLISRCPNGPVKNVIASSFL